MGPAGDTIFALATARGKAGVAIVRLSGSRSVDVLAALGGAPPPARGTRTCRLRDADGSVLDHALVLRFAEGASFTGEEVVELHLHGSIAVVRAVLGAIEATGLARQAEPGEFTRRALLNDRLDLTQVQGLRDMIDAETEVQRRHAMRVYSGEMTERIQHWRHGLVRAIALLEATIDFADEEVPQDVMPDVMATLEQVREALRVEIGGVAAAARIRSGFEVALVGPPNVGKSSLMNRLTRSDAAIVSDIAGTTRDVIEVRMDIKGLSVSFLDMAGLRESSDPVESLGIARARDRAADADMRIFLHDGPDYVNGGVHFQSGDLILRTKVDVHGGSGISAVTGEGVEALLERIGMVLESRAAQAGLTSSDRDRRSLVATVAQLDAVMEGLSSAEIELVVQALWEAAGILRDMIGGVDVEVILDEIFSSFCIGK